jgi:hypothetical protein
LLRTHPAEAFGQPIGRTSENQVQWQRQDSGPDCDGLPLALWIRIDGWSWIVYLRRCPVRRRRTSLARKSSLTIRIGFIGARRLLSVVPIYGLIEAQRCGNSRFAFPAVLSRRLTEAIQ